MPVNGLVWSCETLRLFVESSATGSHTGDGTGSYGHSASLVTQWTPDAIDVYDGFSLGLSGASNGNSWAVTYTGPGAPLGETYTGTGWDSIAAEILLTDLKLYCIGGLWKITFDYEVIAQGVSRRTGSVDTTSGGFGPAYVPLLGIPARLGGSCSASTIGLPTYAPDDLYAYNSTCSAEALGAWEFDQGDGWIGLPVTLAPGSAPSVGGGIGCTDSGIGGVAGEATNDLQIESYAEAGETRTLYATGTITQCCTETYCDGVLYDTSCITQTPAVPWDQYETETLSISRGGSVMALPDLTRGIIRFNSDFRALLYRTEMPQTEYSATWACSCGDPASGGGETEVHPHQSEILEEVTNAEAAMEDTLLDYLGYAPWSASGSRSWGLSYYEISGAVLCPDVVECPGEDDVVTSVNTLVGYTPMPEAESCNTSRSYSFPSSVGSSSDMAAYLGHDEPIARYVNSWPNPHWSYFRWREDWEVDGSPADKDDYWEALGQQWIYNSALTSPTESRNHLISEALDTDAQGPVLDTFMGGLRFVGLCRWQTKAIAPRTTYSYTSASSSLWTGEDCTLSHAGSITVTPSEPVCTVKLNLGSFTVEPFIWPHLANRILCNWSSTNVADLKVYLEGVDGKRVLLNDNDPNVTKDRPSAVGKKYAGSWAQDFGADGITDQGSDFNLSKGMSAATMSDTERSCAFQALSDRTAKYLVFVITPTNPASTVTIHYPTLEYTLSADRLNVWENPYQGCSIHPDGPGVRWGMWNSGTSGTLTNPPLLYDPTTRPTLVDGLVTERLLVRGVAHDDGLTTELTTLFDTYEGQSVGQVRNYSHWFWLPPVDDVWPMALVNSMSEPPPLACWPRKDRDADWAETGSYCLKSWIWAQGPSRFVAPGVTPELREDDDTTVWTALGTGVAGWSVYEHEHALANTEDDFGVWVGGKRLAILRPWRGHFLVPGAGAQTLIAYAVRDDLVNFRGRVSAGLATVQRADNALTAWATVGSTVTAEELSLAVQPWGSILLGVIDAGSYKLYKSDGGSWTLSYTVTSTGAPVNPCVIAGRDGVVFHYWSDGGTVKGRRYDASGTALGAAYSVSGIPTIDEEGVSGDETFGDSGERIIRLSVVVSGSLTVYSSPDGVAFS